MPKVAVVLAPNPINLPSRLPSLSLTTIHSRDIVFESRCSAIDSTIRIACRCAFGEFFNSAHLTSMAESMIVVGSSWIPEDRSEKL